MTIICLINFMQIWMVLALPLAKTLTSVHAITCVDAITCTGVISSVHVTCKDKFNNMAFHSVQTSFGTSDFLLYELSHTVIQLNAQ